MEQILLLQKIEESEKLLAEIKHDTLWRPLLGSSFARERIEKLKLLTGIIEKLLME